MAPQAQGFTQLQELLAILRKRAWQVLLPAAVVLSLGIMVATFAPRKYSVQTVLELRETTLPIGGQGADVTTIQRDVGSAPNQIRSMERVRKVIERLEWRDYTSLKPAEQYEYLQRVIDNLGVATQGNPQRGGSSYVFISYTDTDPLRAEQFANTLRDFYVSEKVEWVRSSARKARDTLQDTSHEAEKLYREKERLAAEIKKEHGLSPTQQAPGGGRERTEDPTVAQYYQTQQNLGQVDGELAIARARLDALRERLDVEPREVEQQLEGGGLDYAAQLQAIEEQIGAQRLLQDGVTPLHSRYKTAQKQIDALERQKQALQKRQTLPSRQIATMPNPARQTLAGQIADLQSQIAANVALRANLTADLKGLEGEVAELQEIYRELSELDGEVRRTLDAYDVAYQAFRRQSDFVTLITQPEFSPFEVVEIAQAPKTPTSPNVPFLIGASLVLGLGLGLAIALAAEFGRNAYRGTSDVTRALAVPVLGTVNRIVTRGESRRLRLRRAVVGTSTLLIVGAILWVTWAYAKKPSMLGTDLTQLIDDVRAGFR